MQYIRPQRRAGQTVWLLYQPHVPVQVLDEKGLAELSNKKVHLLFPVLECLFALRPAPSKHRKTQKELLSFYFKNHPLNVDKSDYHLLVGPRVNDKVWGCAVSQASYQDWMEQLTSAGIIVEKELPEIAPIQMNNGWYVMHDAVEDEIQMVHLDEEVGYFRYPLEHYGQTLIEGLEGISGLIEGQPLLEEGAAVIFNKLAIEQRLPAPFLSSTDWTPEQRLQAWESSVWANKKKFTMDVGALIQPACILVGSVLVSMTMGLQWYAWQAREAVSQQRLVINQMVQQAFPKISVVIDPVKQMNMELASLPATDSNPKDAMALTYWLIGQGVSVSQLEWDGQVLTVRTTAPTPALEAAAKGKVRLTWSAPYLKVQAL